MVLWNGDGTTKRLGPLFLRGSSILLNNSTALQHFFNHCLDILFVFISLTIIMDPLFVISSSLFLLLLFLPIEMSITIIFFAAAIERRALPLYVTPILVIVIPLTIILIAVVTTLRRRIICCDGDGAQHCMANGTLRCQYWICFIIVLAARGCYYRCWTSHHHDSIHNIILVHNSHCHWYCCSLVVLFILLLLFMLHSFLLVIQ